ncbi:MAG: MgtC/SapB family protein [Gammaproteobacteria bacterium]|nr:MAG: MgtC/SapB family protein [Gammaproteobacteria bacterium]
MTIVPESQPLQHLLLFAQAVGIGFLIGLEREKHSNAIAGLRTFTLIALTGALSGYIGTQSGSWMMAPVLATLVAASLIVAQVKSRSREPDTTTVLAGLMTYGLGVALWLGHPLLPGGLAIVVMALLYFRKELRQVPHRLNSTDVSSFLQFAAVAFILLPVLPNEQYGPYDVFNPYQTGWLVVLISGISLSGYLALRFLGAHAGLMLVGLMGGLVSTTATTLVYARYSRQTPVFAPLAVRIILLSHLILFVRVGVVTSVLAPELLKALLPWLAGGLCAGLLFAGLRARYGQPIPEDVPQPEVKNPAELKTAVGFALTFVLVLWLSAFMNEQFASLGSYLVAFFSGLTDVDAITIANLKLAQEGQIPHRVAVVAIVIAFVANFIFKYGAAVVAGHRSIRLSLALGFGSMVAGGMVGLLVFPV